MNRIETLINCLIKNFSKYNKYFNDNCPFNRPEQLTYHKNTISIRKRCDSVRMAIENDQFLCSLYDTLKAWGLGSRGSRLVEKEKFKTCIRIMASEIELLEGYRIGQVSNHIIGTISEKIWKLIQRLSIVDNKSKIVAGTKAMHHILPDLIVPIDRTYTQSFFLWHNSKFQYNQEDVFIKSFYHFNIIGSQIALENYIDNGWNTSITKVIDNTIVGMILFYTQENRCK